MIELNKIYCMDCLEGLKLLEDNSVDAIVTDPPYGLGFMGKSWDTFDSSQFGTQDRDGENSLLNKKNFNILPRYCTDGLYDFTLKWATECFRVLKPGGYLLSFAGTRTQHKICSAIEDAGFEIRDMIAWVYGSGFPKSLNIGKAVDKLQGNEREIIGYQRRGDSVNTEFMSGGNEISKGYSEYEGWGTALKPAFEPITVARKPISEKTVALNVLRWRTGGLNIDGCRIDYVSDDDKNLACSERPNFKNHNENRNVFDSMNNKGSEKRGTPEGRFPANFIHDGSDEVLTLFPETNATKPHKGNEQKLDTRNMGWGFKRMSSTLEDDGGSAARFFYCAKADSEQRHKGLANLESKRGGSTNKGWTKDIQNGLDINKPVKNFHPTVKPIDLMCYLVRLVTPKDGIVLDPFMGSGTTAIACKKEDFIFIGFERDKDYFNIAINRISAWDREKKLVSYFGCGVG